MEQKDLIVRVEKTSYLGLVLNAALGAYNRRTDSISGGLQAIALALSTPHDNSGQVQGEIDKLTAQLKASSDSLKSAVDNAPK